MTAAAQAALRRVVEQYTRNCRFCFICNYLSKIIPALQSRCTRFRFGPLPRDAVQKRLVDIMAAGEARLHARRHCGARQARSRRHAPLAQHSAVGQHVVRPLSTRSRSTSAPASRVRPRFAK
jgi:hypothetical protein